MLFSSIKLFKLSKGKFLFGFKPECYHKVVLLWICQSNLYLSVMVNVFLRRFNVNRGWAVPIYLANSEGTFDRDINDSALCLYKSLGIEIKNLMLSEKASGRTYVQWDISGYIYKYEKILNMYILLIVWYKTVNCEAKNKEEKWVW